MDLNKDGIFVKKNAIKDFAYLNTINSKLYKFLEKKNELYNRNDNCLHHMIVYDKNLFNKILDTIFNIDEVKSYFKCNYILHSIGGVINKPNKESYTHKWHIDSYEKGSKDKLMLNVLVPLCNFTLENGCTKIYPKNSKNYENILLNKGDILFFDSSLTHCTGNNISNNHRNCVTITLIKMYLKPQFDYISLFNDEEIDNMNENLKTLFNYYSQISNNLKDFYNKKYIMK